MKQDPNNTMGAQGRKRTKVYQVDGAPMSFRDLSKEAQVAGVNIETMRRRLRQGDNTRERLFRPPAASNIHVLQGKRARDQAEVDAACAALDSRPRNWTGY